MRNRAVIRVGLVALFLVVGCKSGDAPEEKASEAAAAEEATPAKPASEAKPAETAPKKPTGVGLPDDLPNGLLLAYSQFQVVDGKATAKPLSLIHISEPTRQLTQSRIPSYA